MSGVRRGPGIRPDTSPRGIRPRHFTGEEDRDAFPRFVAAVVVGMWVCTAALAAQDGTKGGQWRSYSGDAGSTVRPLDQINKDNVRNLRILWRRPAVDPTLERRIPNCASRRTFARRRS